MSTEPLTRTLDRNGNPKRDRFFAVPVSTLLPNVVIPFAVHAALSEGEVRYLDKGSTFTDERRQQLQDQKLDILYVSDDEEAEYLSYMQENIRRLLSTKSGTRQENNERLIHATSMVLEELFQAPGSEECAVATRQIAEAALDRIHQEESMVNYLNQLLAPRHDLYLHSLHVCFYGLTLARCLGITNTQILSDLGMGLLIHDAGKLALDMSKYDRAGPLSEEEWRIIRTHPQLGAERVGANSAIGAVALDVVLNHHERIDGSGYPAGKKASELSIYAQLAALANTFARRTLPTPYRKAEKSRDLLQKLILNERGKYDAKLLAHLVRVLSQ